MGNTTITHPRQSFGTIILDVAKNEAIPCYRSDSRRYAEMIRDDIKNRINLQLFPKSWRYKDPDYYGRKLAHGLDGGFLIASGQYVESIIVKETEFGAIVTVKDMMHRNPFNAGKEDIHMFALAKILEYGYYTKTGIKVRAFPHWRPAILKFKQMDMLQRKFQNKETRDRINQAIEQYNLDQVVDF